MITPAPSLDQLKDHAHAHPIPTTTTASSTNFGSFMLPGSSNSNNPGLHLGQQSMDAAQYELSGPLSHPIMMDSVPPPPMTSDNTTSSTTIVPSDQTPSTSSTATHAFIQHTSSFMPALQLPITVPSTVPSLDRNHITPSPPKSPTLRTQTPTPTPSTPLDSLKSSRKGKGILGSPQKPSQGGHGPKLFINTSFKPGPALGGPAPPATAPPAMLVVLAVPPPQHQQHK
ncbi:hypothetical protein HDU97_005081 [Phlyctochytrium planicorne]|nr:hypothetical protein HDU97_005081 [Phlyctochytrium planicorne]